MLDNFRSDLENAKVAEALVLHLFSQLTDAYTFEDVSNIQEYQYKGDIKAIEKATGREIFIEVKNDSRIHETHNVLCEEEVYYKDADYIGKGNMQGDSDVFVVVSQPEQKIYVMDFKKIKENYKKGIYKIIEHRKQASFCYLLSIDMIRNFGGGIASFNYELRSAEASTAA